MRICSIWWELTSLNFHYLIFKGICSDVTPPQPVLFLNRQGFKPTSMCDGNTCKGLGPYCWHEKTQTRRRAANTATPSPGSHSLKGQSPFFVFHLNRYCLLLLILMKSKLCKIVSLLKNLCICVFKLKNSWLLKIFYSFLQNQKVSLNWSHD